MQRPAPAAPASRKPLPAEAADSAGPPRGLSSSRWLGTVYMQAEPGAPSFILRDLPFRRDTLLIVGSDENNEPTFQRTFRHGKADLVDDGAAVEFGAPLVILE